MGQIRQIIVYPVKGAAGISLDSASVQRRGLEHDRRFVLVDRKGEAVTQREHSVLATLQPRMVEQDLHLRLEGSAPITVRTPGPDAPRADVHVWYNETNAVDCGDEAAEWFATALGEPVRLLHMDDRASRRAYKEAPDSEVSFADLYPVMVANEASLQDLNARLASPVPMNRFRPNLVVSGFEPWVEDAWIGARVGSVELRGVAHCERCLVTTIDQNTGEKTGSEPLRTLATFRKIGKGAVFGRFFVPVKLGEIRVEDPIDPVS